MASPSSRQKNGLSASREDVARLLRDGAIHRNPSSELLKLAGQLKELGLVRPIEREYVLCSNPKDRDFPPRNRHCRGRIYLKDDMDESGHEYCCPECERPVFPESYNKRHHTELQTKVLPDGVKSFVRNELARLKVDVKDITEGAFRIDQGDMGVVVCILDYCDDDRLHSRDWAKTHPTCYLVVDPHSTERLLPEEWLARATLADLIVNQVNLIDVITELAVSGQPSCVVEASVPVYSKTVPTIVTKRPDTDTPGRRFVVEVGPKTVRVENEEVVAPQAGIRFEIFQILWAQFLDDLKECRNPEDFTLLKLDYIIKRLQERRQDHIGDEGPIRRAINRLQADIETSFKKRVGDPIDREDIIQTQPWKGQDGGEYGYRINPRTVCARPFQQHSA